MNTPVDTPFVTLGLVTYNQEKYVAEALRSAMNQSYHNLEILVCDDASSDNTFNIIRTEAALYKGPHRLTIHCNSHNMGIGNFNRIMKLSTGRLMVIAHGDDISEPERVAEIVKGWRSSQASLICSNAQFIDHQGQCGRTQLPPGTHPINTLEHLAEHGWNESLLGSTLAWERALFEIFGPLDCDKSPLTTDWILPFRAAILNGIHFVDAPLVKVRQHAGQKNWVYFGDRDIDAIHEGQWSNRLIQFLYMLDTLAGITSTDVIVTPRKQVVERLLQQSIVQTAQTWRTLRNRLYGRAKRSKWVSV